MGELPLKIRSNRYPSLDFWRGVACLMVLVFHATFYFTEVDRVAPDPLSRAIYAVINCMWQGVPIFFVISGYCITASCDNMRYRTHSAGQFFWRRFRRIFPPYWIFLVCAAVLVVGVALLGRGYLFQDNVHEIRDPRVLSIWEVIGNLTLTETWRPRIFGGAETFFIQPAWSLCYEEQFYAVCGLILFVSRRRFFMGACIITALVLLLTALRQTSLFPVGNRVDGFFFDGRWLIFALGIGVYYRLVYATGKAARLIDAAMVAVLLLTIPGARWRSLDLFKELRVGLIFSLLLVFFRDREHLLLDRSLLRPITWCGTMCYSVYLVHWPITKLLSHILYLKGVRGAWPTLLITLPLCTVVSLLFCWAFHLAVERRFMNSAPASERCKPLRSASPAPVEVAASTI